MRRALACAAAAAALWTPGAAAGQGFAGSSQTHVRQLQLRPVLQDTVSRSRVSEDADGRLEFEGYPVVCVTDAQCFFYRSQPVQEAAFLTQEVELTAWGLGVRGLSASVLVRGRSQFGGELEYPRADDRVEAVVAYLELNRDRYRVRAGRQRILSGLGSTGFDGAAVLYDVAPRVRVEAFGGRSLAQGLSEPRHRALRGLDDLDFLGGDEEALVFGGEVTADPVPGSSVALRYQRELFADRSGLLTERASLSGRTTGLRPVTLAGAADYDFAFGRVGRAYLRAQLPVGERVLVEAMARRYMPYFELWTIWGYFNPVGYNEMMLQGSWTPGPALALRAAAGYRRYHDADASVFLRPLENESWRGELGGRMRLGERLTLDGAWTVDGPVGAFTSSGDATLSYRAGERLSMQLRAMAARQIEEFRVGEGTVVGGGGGLDLALGGDVQLAGGVDVYRQTRTQRPEYPDWNQVRSWLSLRVGFGRDPGMPRGGAR